MNDESAKINPSNEDSSQASDERAAFFVDYQNLHALLARQLGGKAHPADYVTTMLEELQRYLVDQDFKQTAIVNAYADFGQLHGDGQAIQQSLYLLGTEPHFVPISIQKNASEIQLCIDAMNVLHNRPDIRSLVILSGDRAYLPLLQQFTRKGRDTFAALLHPPSQDGLSPKEDDFYFDARNLLNDELRRELEQADSQQQPSHRRPQTRPDVTYERVHDAQTVRTLEIIEEYFGQYDEVYLTPLLRKLSELLGDAADPKSIISELETVNAIWLEKRRGSPHDYTVLLVDQEHPDVQEIHADFYDTSPQPPAERQDIAGDEPNPSYGDFNESNYAAEYERVKDSTSDSGSNGSTEQTTPSEPSP